MVMATYNMHVKAKMIIFLLIFFSTKHLSYFRQRCFSSRVRTLLASWARSSQSSQSLQKRKLQNICEHLKHEAVKGQIESLELMKILSNHKIENVAKFRILAIKSKQVVSGLMRGVGVVNEVNEGRGRGKGDTVYIPAGVSMKPVFNKSCPISLSSLVVSVMLAEGVVVGDVPPDELDGGNDGGVLDGLGRVSLITARVQRRRIRVMMTRVRQVIVYWTMLDAQPVSGVQGVTISTVRLGSILVQMSSSMTATRDMLLRVDVGCWRCDRLVSTGDGLVALGDLLLIAGNQVWVRRKGKPVNVCGEKMTDVHMLSMLSSMEFKLVKRTNICDYIY